MLPAAAQVGETPVGIPGQATYPWEASLPVNEYSVVNLQSGTVVTRIPLEIGGVFGPGLDISVFHNSASLGIGGTPTLEPSIGVDLGPGWGFSYGDRLDIDTNYVSLISADGTRVSFAKQAGVWVPPVGVHLSLTEDTSDPNDPVWTLKDKKQWRWRFNSTGQMFQAWDSNLQAEDPNQDIKFYIELTRKQDGRISNIYDHPNARVTGFTYKYSGSDLASIEYNDGFDVYEINLDVATSRIKNITTMSGEFEDAVVAFAYDTAGRITELTDPQGNKYTYEYDTNGRIVKVTDPSPFSSQTQEFDYAILTGANKYRTTYTDRRGKDWKYLFDINKRVTKRRNPYDQTTEQTYDSGWNIASFINEFSNTWTATYDSAGNMLTLTDPLGHKWTWTYDAYNNVRTITPPLNTSGDPDTGKTVEFRFEDEYVSGKLADATHVTSIIEPADGHGNTAATTTIEWDHVGETTGLPQTIGRVTRVTDANGVETRLSYSNEFNVNRQEGPTGQNGNSEDLLHITEDFQLDSRGRVRGRTGYLGSSTTTQIESSEASQTTSCSYGGIIDNENYPSPPAAYLPITWTSPHFPLVTCDTGPCVAQEFDLSGHRLSLTLGHTAAIPDPNNPQLIREEHIYREFGYERDELNRVDVYSLATQITLEYDPNYLVEFEREFSFTYDANGNVLTRTDPHSSVTSYTYDDASRLKTVSIDSVTAVTYTLYDNGLPQYADYENGTRTEWTYDAALRLDKIRHKAPGGALILELDYGWTPDGLVSSIVEGDGSSSATMNFVYDKRGRLIREHGSTLIPAATIDLNYTYDQVGNRLTRTDAAADPDIVTTYTYDVHDPNWATNYRTRNNRLISYETVQDSSVLERVWFAYDAGGHATLTLSNQPSGGTPNRYMARVTQYDLDQHLRYAWLVQVDADPNTGAVLDEQKLALREYLYDSDRARFLVRERDPNTFDVTAADWFEYLGNRIYQDLLVDLTDPESPSISPIARYDQGYSLFGTDDPFGRRFIHSDMLGTTRMITDSNAAVTHTLAYSAFGEILAQGGSVGGSSPSGFPRYGYAGTWGYQNDGLAAGVLGLSGSDFGLVHVGARQYEPATGRFTQRDTLSVFGGLNTYAYAQLSPPNLIDPSGTYAVSIPTVSLTAGLQAILTTVAIGGAGTMLAAMAHQWDWLGGIWGIPGHEVGDAVEALKDYFGIPHNQNVKVDPDSGDVSWDGKPSDESANLWDFLRIICNLY